MTRCGFTAQTIVIRAAPHPRTPPVHAGRFFFCLCSPFEQIEQERVIFHAQKEANYRPNEHATYPVRGNSDDVVGGKSKEGAATKAKTNKDGRNQRREGGSNAAQLLAETAGSPEGK